MFTKISQVFSWKSNADRTDENEDHISSKALDQQTVSIAIQADASSVNSGINTNNNNLEIYGEKCTHSSSKQSDGTTPSIIASFPSLILFALVLISIVLGRQYIIDILIYIDSLDLWESMILFGVMFTIVAFPIMWGYVLLNIACGYTYGFLYGALMTCGCATYALICSHFIIRKFCKSYVERMYVINKQTKVLMEVVSGPNGWKIVMLTRFTPIPFGLQNAIFAVSGIKTIPYLLSSVSGLLLTQLVYSYMGSTLRSIAQVFSDKNSITTWILLSLQVVVTLGLTVFIMRLAKRELGRNVPEKSGSLTESVGIQTNEFVNDLERANTSFARTRTHSRNMSVNIPPIILHGNAHIV